MAPVIKTHEQDASTLEKRKGKRKADDLDEDEDGQGDASGRSLKKKNKQRVLLLSSRGITHRMRHLMNDLEALLPHVKKGMYICMRVFSLARHGYTLRRSMLTREWDGGGPDSKLDSKNHLHLLPELADLHSCNNTLYFEARRHEDLYLWAAKTPNGPSIKLHVQNVHTMDELKMTGNCLKGSRGILSFDAAFEETEWGRLTKELFTHVELLFFSPLVVRGLDQEEIHKCS
jgi:ribosome biogenesis protein BRX1